MTSKAKYLLFLLLSTLAAAQTAVLMPLPRQCFQDTLSSGKPLAGGFLYTCAAGTSCPGNPQATFTDSTGLFQNQNPVTLDAAGCASIWLTSGTAYKIVAQNSFGVQEWTADQVTGLATQISSSFAASTTVAFSATPTFTSIAQNQLFKITLTGNVTSSNLVMSGISAPSVVTFEIIQDGTGNRTFAFPANTSGSVAIDSCANCISTEVFLWDGSAAYLIASSASWSNSGSFAAAVSNLFDVGLGATALVCTDSNKMLTTNCTGLGGANTVVYNGQTVVLGGSGNVNNGAATHSLALNEGNDNPITGVTLTDDQIIVGRSGADPVAASIPDCDDTTGNHLNYDTTTHAFSCGNSGSGVAIVKAKVNATSCSLSPNGGGEWSCSGTISWGTTLSGTSYYGQCAMSCPGGAGSCGALAGGYQAQFFTGTKSTTAMGYTINDDHSGSNGQHYGLSCVAIE